MLEVIRAQHTLVSVAGYGPTCCGWMVLVSAEHRHRMLSHQESPGQSGPNRALYTDELQSPLSHQRTTGNPLNRDMRPLTGRSGQHVCGLTPRPCVRGCHSYMQLHNAGSTDGTLGQYHLGQGVVPSRKECRYRSRGCIYVAVQRVALLSIVWASLRQEDVAARQELRFGPLEVMHNTTWTSQIWCRQNIRALGTRQRLTGQ